MSTFQESFKSLKKIPIDRRLLKIVDRCMVTMLGVVLRSDE